MKEVVAIGSSENVMLFQSVGIQAYIISDETLLKETIDKLANETKIIFVGEALEPLMTDIKKKYEDRTYPIIVSIPMEGIKSSLGLEKLKKDVEKAVGISIF
jgi:V/A-type H+-transporting ATPase subunit F